MYNRRSLRLQNFDYTQDGVYFVTICTHRLAQKFGRVVDGKLALNDLGTLVAEEWQKTAEIRPTVEVDLYVVMPNHIHGILFISQSRRARQSLGNATIRANSLGSIIAQFKSVVTKRSRRLQSPRTCQFGNETTTII